MKSLIAGLRRLVLPFGATTGTRIEIDGVAGDIKFYDMNDNLVGFLGPEVWEVGDVGNLGRRVTLDPLGGIRIRDEDDTLVTVIDEHGYSLRDGETGLVTAEMRHGSFRLVDPNGTDDVEIVTSSAGTLPNPAYRSQVEPSPGSSLVIPAAPLFTTPADDIEIGHVAAWRRATNQVASTTPPAGWTERSDTVTSHAAGTLSDSIATRDPATGTGGTFTSSQSNWDHAVGTHIVVKGGGTVSPSYRSFQSTTTVTTADIATFTCNAPAGLAATDALLAFVSLGVNGGGVPTGWTTPDGFVFLGATFSTSGSGASQSTLAVGVWAHLPGNPVPSTFATTINLPTGTKFVRGTLVAIQNPFLVPGGVQIRLAGRPIRRLLDMVELTANSATLCDFTNISQAYDHLELVYDAQSVQNGAATAQRIRMRYNNTAGTGYFYQLWGANGLNTQGFGTDRILLGGIDDADDSITSAIINILGYSKTASRRAHHASFYWSDGLSLRNEKGVGQWDSTSPIDRITIEVDAGTQLFKAGSRAFLYGY